MLNPAAPIVEAARGDATPARLLECGLYKPGEKIPDVTAWLAEEAYAAAHNHDHHHHHDVTRHDDRVRSFSLTAEKPIPAAILDLFLELLRSMHGPNLLRMKGIVNIEETPDTPVVIHGVQHVLHPPARLERWPDADRRSRLVFIVRDIEPRIVQELFDAFLGTPAPGRPDAAATRRQPPRPLRRAGSLTHRLYSCHVPATL